MRQKIVIAGVLPWYPKRGVVRRSLRSRRHNGAPRPARRLTKQGRECCGGISARAN